MSRKKPLRPAPATQVSVRSDPLQQRQDAISDIADLLPGTTPVQDRVRQVVQQTKFQGPIPHPEIFREYGTVIPDAPERILQVFEKDSAHARDIQFAALTAQKEDNQRVHWMAWSLVACGYCLSLGFAMLGKDWLAGIILGTTLVGTITGFLQSRREDKEGKAIGKD